MTDRGGSLAYRAGLDGVRALAVAAVVLYHGKVGGFDGGFLGVDVFFVLSGFLITSMLLEEHALTGTIDLVRFWVGRVRRLLPAALLVIAVSLVAVAVLSSSDLPALRGDALWSVLYVNNWHQIFADRSYFAAFGRPSLLQHYWSLAVEEQFYLFWPPLLLIGLKRLGAGGVALFALAGAVASGVLMGVLFDPGSDPSRVYYGTDTRALPLLVGVLLAFAWPSMRMAQPVAGVARFGLDAIGLAGFAVVLFGVLTWSDFDPFVYRGGLALVALGAALLVASASHPSSTVGRVLGCAPLVWIGRRSYGIYLWHWPVMAMSRGDLDIRASKLVLVPLQILLTLVLAELSYRFVEMPIRRGTAQVRWREWFARQRVSRRRFALAATPAALVLFVGIVLAWPAGMRPMPVEASSSALARVIPLASADAAGMPGSGAGSGAASPASATGGGGSGASASASGTASDVPTDAASGTGAGAASSAAGSAPASPSHPAPASAARKATTSRGPVLAVGASVMLAAIHQLQSRDHARVDAAVGRQPQAIEQRLQAYRDAGGLPPVVVVQTGENGPLYGADELALKHVLRGVERVVLVTVRVPQASWGDDTNAKLHELASNWPQARLADWHAASANPDLLWDGAHPKSAGAAIYAKVVEKAIRAK